MFACESDLWLEEKEKEEIEVEEKVEEEEEEEEEMVKEIGWRRDSERASQCKTKRALLRRACVSRKETRNLIYMHERS